MNNRNDKPKGVPENWIPIGWHGIQLWAPDDWAFAPSNDPKETRFHLISPDELCLKVQSVKGGQSVDIKATLNKYLKGVEQEHKQKKISFSGKIEDGEKNTLTFSWRSNRKAFGVIRYCPECNNITIAELSGSKNDQVRSHLTQFLSHMKDHQDGDMQFWAIYGIQVSVPKKYNLESYNLTSGYIVLNFEKKGEKIIVERWALADMLMKKYPFDEWTKKQTQLERTNSQLEEAEINGHKGYRFSGSLKLFPRLIEVFYLLRMKRFPVNYITSSAWHCEKTNRLITVTWLHRKPVPMDILLEQSQCHW